MEFSIGSAKFLLLFVFCIAMQSCVDAENKVTVNTFNTNVPDNDAVASWDFELVNSLISSIINVTKDCPGAVTADIRVFQGRNMINAVNKQFPQPLKDFEDLKLCGLIDYPIPEEDTCSMAAGEQCAEECDISPLFGDMDPGEYRIECDFKQEDTILTYIFMDVLIEGEESE